MHAAVRATIGGLITDYHLPLWALSLLLCVSLRYSYRIYPTTGRGDGNLARELV